MPQYIFQHPKTKKIIEVIQSMNDEHVYVDKAGVKWNRLFTSPQAAIDTKIDIHNPKDFVEKTGRKKGTVGDLWDQSQEASIKREQKEGRDPIKENYYTQYSKKRKGKKHPDVVARENNNFVFKI